MATRPIGSSHRRRRPERSHTGPSRVGRCRWCGVDVYWLKYPSTGKLAPIDLAPAPGGNIVIDLAEGTYAIVPKDDLTLFDATKAAGDDAAATLHWNHWATCTNATAQRLARERHGAASHAGTGLMTVDGEPVRPGDVPPPRGLEAPPEFRAQHQRCAGCGFELAAVLLAEGLDRHPGCEGPPPADVDEGVTP